MSFIVEVKILINTQGKKRSFVKKIDNKKAVYKKGKYEKT